MKLLALLRSSSGLKPNATESPSARYTLFSLADAGNAAVIHTPRAHRRASRRNLIQPPPCRTPLLRLTESKHGIVLGASYPLGRNANRSPAASPAATRLPAMAGPLRTAECVSKANRTLPSEVDNTTIDPALTSSRTAPVPNTSTPFPTAGAEYTGWSVGWRQTVVPSEGLSANTPTDGLPQGGKQNVRAENRAAKRPRPG